MLHKLHVQNPMTGHDTLEFDPESPQSKEFLDASETFNRLVVQERSFFAGVKLADRTQSLTHTFRPDAVETVLTPRTVGG